MEFGFNSDSGLPVWYFYKWVCPSSGPVLVYWFSHDGICGFDIGAFTLTGLFSYTFHRDIRGSFFFLSRGLRISFLFCLRIFSLCPDVMLDMRTMCMVNLDWRLPISFSLNCVSVLRVELCADLIFFFNSFHE